MSGGKILINVSEDGEFQAEFETLEINRKNKIFKINGIDFGKGCSSFSLTADYEGIVVRMVKEIKFISPAVRD